MGRKRSESDEWYVLDLCDEILGERSLRQHHFEWLTGDPSPKTGRRAKLPVDGYWPRANLVVEYRERQHSEAVAHFDKPDRLTVSGVHRGIQRAIYDQRREALIPAHGIALATIYARQLSSTQRGHLTRDTRADTVALRRILSSWRTAE